MSYAAAGHSIVRASIILSRVKTPRPCRRGIAACVGPRGAVLVVCSFSKSAPFPTAALRFRALEWRNGTQGLLGHFRYAWADSGFYLAYHVVASCYDSHRLL